MLRPGQEEEEEKKKGDEVDKQAAIKPQANAEVAPRSYIMGCSSSNQTAEAQDAEKKFVPFNDGSKQVIRTKNDVHASQKDFVVEYDNMQSFA